MEAIKVGYIGAGNISAVMANTINKMETAVNYCVAARDLKRAEEFKNQYGFEKAYGSYEEMLEDKEVELIYVATPHSHHAEHIKMCINHGKAVLCEKAFTANAKEAEEVLNLAKEKKVLVSEAIWTRYMPSRQMISDLIEKGTIGDVIYLTANLGYKIEQVKRLTDPALAGGALLDVGVYTINFARMVLGNELEKIESTVTYTESGVDRLNSLNLTFKNNRVGMLSSTMSCNTNREGIIYGTDGYLVIENINNPASISVYDGSYQLKEKIMVPPQISGYEYEVEAAVRAIRQGELECLEMPHEEIIAVMKIMDACRNDWGIVYPFEK